MRSAPAALALLTTLWSASCGAQSLATPGPSRNSHSQEALKGLESSRLGMTQAIEAAETESGGKAVEATFTPFARGGGAHEIEVMRPDGTLARYDIDANAGSVVGVTNEVVASALTSLTPDALRAAQGGLGGAVKRAEEQSPGQRAIGASAEQNDGRISYRVTLATHEGDRTVALDDAGKIQPE